MQNVEILLGNDAILSIIWFQPKLTCEASMNTFNKVNQFVFGDIKTIRKVNNSNIQRITLGILWKSAGKSRFNKGYFYSHNKLFHLVNICMKVVRLPMFLMAMRHLEYKNSKMD